MCKPYQAKHSYALHILHMPRALKDAALLRSASSLDLEWQSGLSLVVPAHTSGDPEGQHIVGVRSTPVFSYGMLYFDVLMVHRHCFIMCRCTQICKWSLGFITKSIR